MDRGQGRWRLSLQVFLLLGVVFSAWQVHPGKAESASSSTEDHSGHAALGAGEAVDPVISRFFLLPTHDIMPAGHGAYGLAEVFVGHLTYSPTGFLQLGAATPVYPPFVLKGVVLAFGGKVLLWKATGSRPGLAVGGSVMTAVGFDDSEDGAVARTVYAVTGFSSSRFTLSIGVFRVTWRTPDVSPHYSNLSPRHDRDDGAAVFGALGIAVPIASDTSALLEMWGPAWGEGIVPSLGLLGFRKYTRRAAADFGLILRIDRDKEFEILFPILNVSFLFG